jgi:hypothetical protein
MNAQGTGQGAILDASYRLVDASNPAVPGTTVLQIFCTGLGPVTHQPPSGSPAPTSAPFAETMTTPTVTVGGIPAHVVFSGLAPGFVGEYQVNAQVPATVSGGNAVPVVISIGGITSNTVAIAVQGAPGSGAGTPTSVSPASGSAGQSLTVVITGANTSFAQGQTLATFGPGISVAGAPDGQPGVLTVGSPTSATAELTIDPSTATGSRTLTVTTGAQTASLSNAFTVLAPQGPLGPLSITSTSPANGAIGVSLTPTIQIAFNEPLDPATVGPSAFTLASGNAALPAAVAYNSALNVVTITPAGVLGPQTTYSVKVLAQVRNVAESPLASVYTFSFVTVPPASVGGSITPTSGLDPTTLTVVSFAGNTTTPASNGSFSAMLNPQGTSLVAAMFPGKSFGLLAMTIGGMATGSSTASSDFQDPAPTKSRVHTTRWQVTASAAAATSSDSIVVDFQTTAESFVFMSPYLLTADGQRAPAIQSAIASNPATAELADVLAQSWSEADPLSNSMVQSALQNAVQAVVQALVSQSPAYRSPAHSAAASSTSWSPPTAAATPYCWNFSGHIVSISGLQCLDLDYISLPAGTGITVDQSTGNYVVSPTNCANPPLPGLGCATGWLARVTPIPASSDGGNPDTIVAGGPDAFGPESPVGAYDSAPCDQANNCTAIWLDGNSSLQGLNLEGDFISAVSTWVASLGPGGSAPSVPSFWLPAPTQQETDYIIRFYSGGIADAGELTNVLASNYSDGRTLFLAALGLNAMESAFNVIDAVNILPDNVASCALEGTAQLLIEGSVTVSVAQTQSDLESAFQTVYNGAVGQVVSCAKQNIFSTTVEMLGKLFTWGTGVGTVLDTLSAVSNLGQAVQRVTELAFTASPVETAVVAIVPGSSVTLDPVPYLTSLSPSSVAAGSSSITVVIKGENFLSSSTVAFNGTTQTGSFVNSGQLTIMLNAAELATAGSYPIVVTNPSPGGGNSNSMSFTVSSAAGASPSVSSLSPGSYAATGSNQTMLINGSNFQSGATVTFHDPQGNPYANKPTTFVSGQLS